MSIQDGKTSVGIKNLKYWLMTTEEDYETAPTYDSKPTDIADVININMQPSGGISQLEASDRISEIVSYKGMVTLSINSQEMPLKVRAALLGNEYDEETGVLTDKITDAPPYFALGFDATDSNGNSKSYVFYKCKASVMTQNFQTLTQSGVNWATPQFTITAIGRRNDGVTYRTCAPGSSAQDTWFKATPYEPSPSTESLSQDTETQSEENVVDA